MPPLDSPENSAPTARWRGGWPPPQSATESGGLKTRAGDGATSPARPAAAELAPRLRPPPRKTRLQGGVGGSVSESNGAARWATAAPPTPVGNAQRCPRASSGCPRRRGFGRASGRRRGGQRGCPPRGGGLGGAQAPSHVPVRYYVQREKDCPETRVFARPPPALFLNQPCTFSESALHFMLKKCLTERLPRAQNDRTFRPKGAVHGTYIQARNQPVPAAVQPNG